MTFRELMQIENFIAEIESLKNLSISGDEMKIKAEALNGRISACVKEYNSDNVKIDWDSAWKYEFCNGYSGGYYDVDRIKDILSIMQSALQGILNRLPYYDEVCDLTKDISRGYNLDRGDNKQKKINFIVEMVKKYSSNIKFDQSIVANKDNLLTYLESNELQIDTIFKSVYADLGSYRMSLCSENRDLKDVVNPTISINVAQNQNNTQNQYLSNNIQVSIETCFKELDDCETISENEIAEIKAQIGEIQKLLEDKKGKKKTIREKIKGMLKWVADKGTDVMITLLPMLLSVLNVVK